MVVWVGVNVNSLVRLRLSHSDPDARTLPMVLGGCDAFFRGSIAATHHRPLPARQVPVVE